MSPFEVLFVSKPIAPPWNDGTRNLVRDLAQALGEGGRVRPVVLGRRGRAPAVPRARTLALFPADGPSHTLGPRDHLRMTGLLAVGRIPRRLHFVAAPTPQAAAIVRRLAPLRGLRTVQTVASAPGAEADLAAGLFGERIVVLSRAMEARARTACPRGARVIRIPPPVRAPIVDASVIRDARAELSPDGAPVILFPGDLGPDRGAEPLLRALASLGRARLVVAARPKGDPGGAHLSALESLARSLGIAERVRSVGETSKIHAYLAAADVVALPATDSRAKIDLPLALVEAMLLGRPVLVAEGAPAADLADDGAALLSAAEPEAIAARLAPLLASAAERAALGTRAEEHARRVFSPASVARAHEALYEGLGP